MAQMSGDIGNVPPGQQWQPERSPEPDRSEEVREAFAEAVQPAEPAAAPEPEPEEEYSDFRFSDVFRQVDPEEQAREEQARELAALHDGSAISEAVQGEAASDRAFAALKQRAPGVDSPEAIAAMRPALERIGERYGYEAAADPAVIERTFQALGGSERFAPPAEEQAYMSALRVGVPRDAFSG